jgi:hypothetical protein
VTKFLFKYRVTVAGNDIETSLEIETPDHSTVSPVFIEEATRALRYGAKANDQVPVDHSPAQP